MADSLHKRLFTANGDLRMSAYYYSFDPTGVEAIDRILAAVAAAGKGYHGTEYWSSEPIVYGDENGPTYIDLIQRMADEAAEAMRSPRTSHYDRDVLVSVLVYHYRKGIEGCGCGWAELGRSHPEHVATVYEESIRAHDERC